MVGETKKRVLMIDDSQTALNVLKFNLMGSDFDVVAQYRDPKQALEDYCNVSPDVVLLDYEMPDLSGPMVLEKLISLDNEARVIMVSGSIFKPEQIEHCRRIGARVFLQKPFDPQELLALMREHAK